MATHPVESEADEASGHEPLPPPNTSQLPIEPEFLPELAPAEPEDPGAKKLTP